MMFKYSCMVSVLAGILLWGAVNTAAASLPVQSDNLAQQLVRNNASSDEAEVIKGGGDVLLIYPDEVTDQVLQNVDFLAEAAACLNKQLVFVSASEAVGNLSIYPRVLCYALNGDESELMQEFREYEGEKCIFGGAFLREYLDLEENKGDVSGVFQYSFNDIEWFESSVNLQDIPVLPKDSRVLHDGRIILHEETLPFFCEIEEMAYCPVTDFSSPLLREAVIQELTLWQWPYQDKPPSYPQYLVLDQIYPFMPAERLLDWVQLCIDSNIPFVMNVMPIYQNEEFPAMQQFCEVLKYAQENGGAAIMHAPILHGDVEDFDVFRAEMTKATVAYTDRGVYPLGLAVPRSWIWDSRFLEFMRRYRTVFVYRTEDPGQFDLSVQTNLLYQNYHQLIMPATALDGTGMSYLTNYSSAIYIDVREDIRDLEHTIQHLKKSSAPLKSLWEMDHSVWADNFHLSCVNAEIEINDQPQAMDYQPEAYQEDYVYNRNVLQRITVSLKTQNKKLLAGSAAATAAFLLMIVWARIKVVHYFRHRNKLPKKRKFFSTKKRMK